MEENKIYPEQPEEQRENPMQDPVPGDIVQEVQFEEQSDLGELNASGADNCQSNGCQENTFQNNAYQNNVYQNNGYPAYQNGSYQDNNYQNSSYQSNNYQNGSYQGSNYQNSSYQGNNYQNSSYQDNNYQSGSYQNKPYSGSAYQNYGTNYEQYNTAPSYLNDQMELEEPVKVSEWVLAMILMMIPCVNIIMMFVWAFSSTEKKSKSNFFKAYLIFFGISIGVMILVWLAVILFALML